MMTKFEINLRMQLLGAPVFVALPSRTAPVASL